MDFSDFLNGLRAEGTSGQRRRQIALAREAAQDARDARGEQARKDAAVERRERVALTVSQLGIDAGEVTRANMVAGDAQAVVDDLEARLVKARKTLAACRQHVADIARTMDAAMEMASEPAVRSMPVYPLGVPDGLPVPVSGGWLGG